ncbi:MAG: ABC transporter permease [Sporichthyaceae bacterium]|nr:ABC transporter permease [Sporichthyaceae bacterium]
MSDGAGRTGVSDPTARLVQRMLVERGVVRLASIALVVLVIFSLASGNFFSIINFQSMGFQVAEIGLLSLAIALTMLTGGIDLSIVSIANIAAIVTAQLFMSAGSGTASGSSSVVMTVGFIAVGVAAGTACGALNGLLITRLRITPILATLGTLQLLNGVAIVWTGGRAIYGMPESFLNIGTGFVAGVPAPVVVLLLAAVGTAVFVNRTGMGLRIKLVGANPTAARYSGLNNDRVLMRTYLMSAFLSSLAGILIAARSASANADYGASYVLLAIVIVVLGGVNPMGGSGTVTGVVLSAFVLQMVASGFNMVGFNSFLYQIAQGVILIGVLGLSTITQRYDLRSALRMRSGRDVDGAPSEQLPAALGPPVPPREREHEQ